MATIPTVRVKRKSDGVELVINDEDFDSAKHKRVEKKAAPAASGAASTSSSSTGQPPLPPEETLRTMTISALRALPQWKDVKDASSLTTKDDIVAALLKTKA